ncbi:MAG: peroxiredoxin [Erysipelotrichaceae bacterium]|nr:peroxiredoxin [Erysipelotrichaceae bacterium]
MLKINDIAPDFSLQDYQGKIHQLSDYQGKRFILYFYPKDNTAGCSAQACGYNAELESFKDLGVEIIGISKDSIASHEKFIMKYNLNFTILSDPELTAIKAYDVWHEKKLCGKEYMGVVRTTYLIDNGVIVYANDKVKAKEDARKMLELLK